MTVSFGGSSRKMSSKKYRFPDASSSSRNDIGKEAVESDIDRLAQEILTLGQRKRSFNEQERVTETIPNVEEMRSRSSSRGRRISGSEFDNLATMLPRNSSFNLGEQDLDSFSEGQTIVRWVDKRPLSNRYVQSS